jgi:glycosyltransferase involved in cell wall biosynthesis
MLPRLTIVHVLTRLLRAGSEENTLHACEAQAAAGHRVVLVHGRDFDPGMVGRARSVCEVVQVASLVHAISPLSDCRAVYELRRLFRQIGADVVHTHQSKAGILGRLAAVTGDVRLIVHGVHILPWVSVSPPTAALYLAAERWCARFTDAFISVSGTVRDECISQRVGRAAQHHVALSAMDVDRFRGAVAPQDLRELLGVPDGQGIPPVALMMAAFEPRKRHAQVVDALPEAFRGVADWRVVFAGAGPELAAIRDRVERRGLANNVRFAGHRSDPECLIAMADVCFLTSEREGLPRVLVQYAAAEKPIVVSQLPGLNDLFEGRDAAQITPSDDVPAALEAVARLMADPAARARLVTAVRAVKVDAWSPANMANSIDLAYLAACETSRRRRPGGTGPRRWSPGSPPLREEGPS